MCRFEELRRSARTVRRGSLPMLLLAGLLCAAGCRQQMADQPRHKPLSASSFYADGSARPLLPGTVPHGSIQNDFLNVPHESDEFPLPVTGELLARGQERYTIFCGVCHGAVGDGNGMVVRRGYRQPPTYHSDRLRQAPVGHFYDVIVRGFGAMPDYAAQVPPHDRWAIIAYIRALQFSQYAPLAQLPPELRRQLEQLPGATPGPRAEGAR